MEAINYEELDPGIRKLVRLLRDNGFNTTDSGDGATKVDAMPCALDYPHVFIRVYDPSRMVWEEERLYELLRAHVTDASKRFTTQEIGVQLTYSSADGIALLQVRGVLDKDLKEGTGPRKLTFGEAYQALLRGKYMLSATRDTPGVKSLQRLRGLDLQVSQDGGITWETDVSSTGHLASLDWYPAPNLDIRDLLRSMEFKYAGDWFTKALRCHLERSSLIQVDDRLRAALEAAVQNTLEAVSSGASPYSVLPGFIDEIMDVLEEGKIKV